MTDEVEPLDAPEGAATGVGGATPGSESSSPETGGERMSSGAREDNHEEADLLQLYKRLSVEGKWFLRALQHFNSKLQNRATLEMYISDYEDFIAAETRTSFLEIEFLERRKGDYKIHFYFVRKELDCDDGELMGISWIKGEWDMPVTENGKAIVRGFWEILVALPYDLEIPFELNRFMEKVEALDDLIRKEKSLIRGKEITQIVLREGVGK
jgi:hypothetical protein